MTARAKKNRNILKLEMCQCVWGYCMRESLRQKISQGNHLSYATEPMCCAGRTDKGGAICPTSIEDGGT